MFHSVGVCVLLIAVPALTFSNVEQKITQHRIKFAGLASEIRDKRMTRLLIGELLSKCEYVYQAGGFRLFRRGGGSEQLIEDFKKLAPNNVHRSLRNPHIGVGNVHDKKVEINLRKTEMNIMYSKDTVREAQQRFHDQIIYTD